jgi:membrane peptidoglycan carboxypeptidase
VDRPLDQDPAPDIARRGRHRHAQRRRHGLRTVVASVLIGGLTLGGIGLVAMVLWAHEVSAGIDISTMPEQLPGVNSTILDAHGNQLARVASTENRIPVPASPARPEAGKTGTVESHLDAWFCGYTPSLAACVWMGFPQRGVDDPRGRQRRVVRRRLPGDHLAPVHDLRAGGRAAAVPAGRLPQGARPHRVVPALGVARPQLSAFPWKAPRTSAVWWTGKHGRHEVEG